MAVVVVCWCILGVPTAAPQPWTVHLCLVAIPPPPPLMSDRWCRDDVLVVSGTADGVGCYVLEMKI